MCVEDKQTKGVCEKEVWGCVMRCVMCVCERGVGMCACVHVCVETVCTCSAAITVNSVLIIPIKINRTKKM